jgi:hypothetical protein
MSKRKSPTIVPDEKGHPFAVNRKARRTLAAMGVPHTAVPMQPLKRLFRDALQGTRTYLLNGDELTLRGSATGSDKRRAKRIAALG